jgi:triosephosphate isomerase
MKKIVANFKMNGTNISVKDYLVRLLSRYEKDKTEVVFCPPFTSISMAKFLVEGTGIKLGGQNLCDDEDGGCTGEISGAMLKEAGCDYVIIGHSDRRIKFKESMRSINKKIKIALKNRLKVVLCVGETLAEKTTGKRDEILQSQVEDSFKGLYENELENITIAYEPVWAISTGKIPQTKEIVDAVKTIRTAVSRIFSEKAGNSIEIIYGGSVDNKNYAQIMRINDINGLMIGSASLDSDNFSQIIKNIK